MFANGLNDESTIMVKRQNGHKTHFDYLSYLIIDS
jgi:hypothetical protein